MSDWILIVLLILISMAIGATAHSAWIERRHDCLPHDPDSDRCWKGSSSDPLVAIAGRQRETILDLRSRLAERSAVGPCASSPPLILTSPPPRCRLLNGHDGDHISEEGTRWWRAASLAPTTEGTPQ